MYLIKLFKPLIKIRKIGEVFFFKVFKSWIFVYDCFKKNKYIFRWKMLYFIKFYQMKALVFLVLFDFVLNWNSVHNWFSSAIIYYYCVQNFKLMINNILGREVCSGHQVSYQTLCRFLIFSISFTIKIPMQVYNKLVPFLFLQ